MKNLTPSMKIRGMLRSLEATSRDEGAATLARDARHALDALESAHAEALRRARDAALEDAALEADAEAATNRKTAESAIRPRSAHAFWCRVAAAESIAWAIRALAAKETT